MVHPGRIELEERPMPKPGPGQVLIEVRAVGVCGSDVHWFTEGRIGELSLSGPLVLGHEAAGVVRALGPGTGRLKVGQRVSMEPGVPCGRCRACRCGQYNLCPDVRFFATPPVDGTFARYVTHDEDFCYPLPDHLSDDAGALLEPLSVAVWSTWKARIAVGDRVLVTGAGRRPARGRRGPGGRGRRGGRERHPGGPLAASQEDGGDRRCRRQEQ